MGSDKFRITISCDDVNPSPQYRLLGTPTEKWFRSLNEEFGAKFTLFVPSCYHKQWPISEHRGWIGELNELDWIELAAHGHFHQTSNPQRFGECEFFELQDAAQIQTRIYMMRDEWGECGCKLSEMGYRNPGWLCSPESKYELQCEILYSAIHYEHNGGLEWQCKTFFGHDGIHQQNIGIHNENMIMFQSHIAGKHNHNVWNEHNFEQLRTSLAYLCENYDCEFKTLNECVNY